MSFEDMVEFIEIPCKRKKHILIQGVGINDAKYMVIHKTTNKAIRCPYYTVWVDMLKRCYNRSFHKTFPSYISCLVCTEWLTFSNFRLWMEKQDWLGKQLDKDLLVRGNKIYSPSTCLFVTQEINVLLLDRARDRGKYLIGVTWNKRDKKYQAQCSVKSKNIVLGKYISELEAHLKYMSFKKQHIISIANEQTDKQLKLLLLSIADTEY